MTERHWQGCIPPHLAGRRLDQALAELVPGVSRAEVQRLIREGHCSVDGREAKAGERVEEGAHVVLELAEPTTAVAPERAPLSVLYEDATSSSPTSPRGWRPIPRRAAPRGRS